MVGVKIQNITPLTLKIIFFIRPFYPCKKLVGLEGFIENLKIKKRGKRDINPFICFSCC
jgi:hypothetical protein